MLSLHRSNKQQEKENKFERIQTEHIKSEYLFRVELILEFTRELDIVFTLKTLDIHTV